MIFHVPPKPCSGSIGSVQHLYGLPDVGRIRVILIGRERQAAGAYSHVNAVVGIFIFHHRQQFGIPRTTVLSPCFHSERKNGNPLLSDNTFQILFKVSGTRFPGYSNSAYGIMAVFSHRIYIVSGNFLIIFHIRIGSRRFALVK